jgi:hypothetical protein
MNSMNMWCTAQWKALRTSLLLALLLTSATTTPVLVNVASAQAGSGSKQVVYHTADGHVHELYVTTDGIWQHADLTSSPARRQRFLSR